MMMMMMMMMMMISPLQYMDDLKVQMGAPRQLNELIKIVDFLQQT